MNLYQSVIDCTLNHYRDASSIKFPALIRFINTTARQVFERELTENEKEKVFKLAMAALFN